MQIANRCHHARLPAHRRRCYAHRPPPPSFLSEHSSCFSRPTLSVEEVDALKVKAKGPVPPQLRLPSRRPLRRACRSLQILYLTVPDPDRLAPLDSGRGLGTRAGCRPTLLIPHHCLGKVFPEHFVAKCQCASPGMRCTSFRNPRMASAPTAEWRTTSSWLRVAPTPTSSDRRWESWLATLLPQSPSSFTSPSPTSRWQTLPPRTRSRPMICCSSLALSEGLSTS